MIDITINDTSRKVYIDMSTYSYETPENMIELIFKLVNVGCFSGETITLWRMYNDKKVLIAQFHSNPRTS
jgi:hypothetical protein